MRRSIRNLLPHGAFVLAATILTHSGHAQQVTKVNEITLTSAPMDVAITPNSQWAIVRPGASDGVQFYKLDGSIGGSIGPAATPSPAARLIALSPNGAIAGVLGGAPSSAMFFNMDAPVFPQVIGSFDFGGPGMDIAIAPNGQFAVVVVPGVDGGTAFVRLPQGNDAVIYGACGTLSSVPERMIAISPNSARAVTVTSTVDTEEYFHNAIQVWDTSVDPPEPVNSFNALGEAHDLEIAPNGAYAFIRTRSTALHPGSSEIIVDLVTGEMIFDLTLDTHPSGARSVAIAPDSHSAYIFGGADPEAEFYTSVHQYDPISLPPTGWSGFAWETTPRDMAYSSDGQWWIGMEDAHWLMIDRVHNNWYGFTNDTGSYPANTSRLIAFTPNNTRAVIAGRTLMWTISTCSSNVGGGVGWFQEYHDPHHLALAPNGRWAVVNAGAGPAAVSFWPTERGFEWDAFESTHSPSPDACRSVAISADGTKVVAISGTGSAGTVQIFDVVVTCRADFDDNFAVEPSDIAAFINAWLECLNFGGRSADYDNNCAIEPADIAAFVNDWLFSLSHGC